jgi:hypothetical protein
VCGVRAVCAQCSVYADTVSHGSKLTNDEVKFVAPQWYLDLLAKQQTSKVGDALCGLLMWMMRARRDEAAKASRKPKLRGRH